MDGSKVDPIPAELGAVAERLEAERPRMAPLELDAVKARAMRRARSGESRGVRRTKGVLMRSRLALVAIVAMGIIFSGTGATLAVSGLSSSDSAGSAQYRPAGDGGGEIVGGDGDLGDPGTVVRATEQVAAQGDGGLPLTGFAAIPLLIGGVGLLGAGVVIRRKTAD